MANKLETRKLPKRSGLAAFVIRAVALLSLPVMAGTVRVVTQKLDAPSPHVVVVPTRRVSLVDPGFRKFTIIYPVSSAIVAPGTYCMTNTDFYENGKLMGPPQSGITVQLDVTKTTPIQTGEGQDLICTGYGTTFNQHVEASMRTAAILEELTGKHVSNVTDPVQLSP